MSIQFILGGTGSGKSHYLAEKIIQESVEHPERSYLIIVPEQATLQTQLKYVALHPRKGLLNIDVISFERLAHRVLDETGAGVRTVLTDTGKSLLIRSLAEEIRDKLAVFGRNFRKPGYINEMKSLLSEMAQYRAKGVALDEIIGMCGDNPLLKDKLCDIKVLQEAFEAKKEDSAITGEELLERLGRCAGSSRILKGTTLCFDGFTGFTPVQTEVLYELLKVSGPVYFTATIGNDRDPFADRGEFDLFRMTTLMCRDIADIAVRLHIEIKENIRVNQGYRYKSPDIITLENSLFRPGRMKMTPEGRSDNSKASGVFEGERGDGAAETAAGIQRNDVPENILVHQVRNPREEVRLAASLICEYVRRGYRYRDIGIIAGSMEKYAPYWESIFSERGIPFFLDMKRNALTNSCVEFVRAALELIEDRYSYSAMFRFLKTGYAGIDEKEIFHMENYCLATGVRGYKRWHEAWEKPIKGMDEKTLRTLDTCRNTLMEILLPYEKVMRKGRATVRARIRALYELMCSMKLEDTLLRVSGEFEDNGQKALAGEYSQIYSLVIGLFDQMVLLLGDEEVTVTEFAQLMDAGLGEIRIGILPPEHDQVMIGDMERSRMGQIRVLIVTGFNDGLIPGACENTSIINDGDRRYLQEKGIRTAPTRVQKNITQRFYLYLNLAHPEETLHICYSNADMEGESLRHSYYLYELKKIFPGLETINEVPNESRRDIGLYHRDTLKYLAENIGNCMTDNTWKQLYSGCASDSEGRRELRLIEEGACKGQKKEKLSERIARALYGEIISTGITGLERFGECPFGYFIDYALKLKERQIFGFEAPDLGNVIHEALHNYGKLLGENELTWTTVDEETGNSIRSRAFDMAAQTYGYSVLGSSYQMEYYTGKLKELFDTTVMTLTDQLRMGEYEPMEYEKEFDGENTPGFSMKLGDIGELKLKGKIDRVDVALKGEEAYVKVMDYKTGDKKFDLTGIYKGLDLQLFAYLGAAMERAVEVYPDRRITPGGVLYYHVDAPLTGEDESSENTELLKKLRPDGAVNVSDANLALFDRGFADPEYKGGNAIRVTKKKDGGFTSGSQVLSGEEFEIIGRYLQNKIARTGREILSGNIEVSPVSGIRDGCRYCEYSQICGFDRSIPGCTPRYIKSMNREEILARMRAEKEPDKGTEQL